VVKAEEMLQIYSFINQIVNCLQHEKRTLTESTYRNYNKNYQ